MLFWITQVVVLLDPVLEGEAPLVAYKSAPFKHSHGRGFPDFPIRAKGVSMGGILGSIR